MRFRAVFVLLVFTLLAVLAASAAVAAPPADKPPKGGLEVVVRQGSAVFPPTGNERGLIVQCAPGEIPLGGGWHVSAPGVAYDLYTFTASRVWLNNSVPEGWEVWMANGSSQDITLVVHANCVKGTGIVGPSGG